MRYWAYFAAKLVVVGATLFGLLAVLNWWWPPQPQVSGHVVYLVPPKTAEEGQVASGHTPEYTYIPPRFGYDLGYTTAVLVWFLLSTGAIYLVIWDQRYRCRVCLRRLRMPVETGSWSRMLLLGRPRIEYICLYGHGTLKEDELQISGLENPEWTRNSDDIWEELCASSNETQDEQ